MNFPCPNPINCEGADLPLANLSSEKPDRRTSFGYSFFPDFSLLCIEEDAELALICNPPIPTNPPTPVIYSSNAKTCTLRCADGSTETYTVAPGTFVALSQTEADALAAAFACVLAQILCDGGTINVFRNTAQSCTMACPDGTSRTYTVAAGLFTALTQVDANANAYLFACALATLLCSGNPPTGGASGAGFPPPNPEQPLWSNSPQICIYTCPDGSTFTYTAPAGLFIRQSAAEANAVAQSYACYRATKQRVCLSSIPTEACASELYSQEISATGLTNAEFTMISGSLPPGIVMFANLLIGYPILGGTYTFTIQATSGAGTAQRTYSIRVLEITPDSLANGTTSAAYAQALDTIGAQGSLTWTVAGGSLPPGLALNPNTGVISGTPTLAGDYDFVIEVTES